jgi:hypothetical protein
MGRKPDGAVIDVGRVSDVGTTATTPAVAAEARPTHPPPAPAPRRGSHR